MNGITSSTQNTQSIQHTQTTSKANVIANDCLSELKQKNPSANITVAYFTNEKQFDSYMLSTGGANNVVLPTNILEQIAKDPAAAVKYEKLIGEMPDNAKASQKYADEHDSILYCSGMRINKNGKVTYWAVSGDKKPRINPGTVFKEEIEKQIAEKREARKAEEKLEAKRLEKAESFQKLMEQICAFKQDTKTSDGSNRVKKENKSIYDLAQNTDKVAETIDDSSIVSHSRNEVQTSRFTNVRELTDYPIYKYEDFKHGKITISKSYFGEYLNDEEKHRQLENTLSGAEKMIKDADENTEGFVNMKVGINTDGKIETDTYSGKVMFNEGKRAAQIAAAMTNTDINIIMSILSKDLSDCESGLEQGFCDKNEVSKVRSMIQKAEAKQLQIATQEGSKKAKGEETPDILTINLLI